MAEEKLDQILGEIRSLKAGQQKLGVELEKVASDVKGIADGHIDLRRDMREMKIELKAEISLVNDELNFMAKDLTKQIKETRQDIHRVEEKLDAHMLQPAQA